MTRTPQRIDKKELHLSSTVNFKYAKRPDHFFLSLMTLYGHFEETEKFRFQVSETLVYLGHQTPASLPNSDGVAFSVATFVACSKEPLSSSYTFNS